MGEPTQPDTPEEPPRERRFTWRDGDVDVRRAGDQEEPESSEEPDEGDEPEPTEPGDGLADYKMHPDDPVRY